MRPYISFLFKILKDNSNSSLYQGGVWVCLYVGKLKQRFIGYRRIAQIVEWLTILSLNVVTVEIKR